MKFFQVVVNFYSFKKLNKRKDLGKERGEGREDKIRPCQDIIVVE
jgi:hypothetical protein